MATEYPEEMVFFITLTLTQKCGAVNTKLPRPLRFPQPIKIVHDPIDNVYSAWYAGLSGQQPTEHLKGNRVLEMQSLAPYAIR